MKCLHSADWHLREKDIEEAERCLAFMIETARTEAVDLIVVAGDIFHSQEIKLDSLSARLAVKTVSALADVAPVAIVLGTASHDGRAPQVMCFAKGKHDVRVSSDPEQIFLYQGCFYESMVGNIKPEAVLTMIPQPTKQYFKSDNGIGQTDAEISSAMTGMFAGFGATAQMYSAPHILVGHFNVAGSMLSNGQVRTGMDIEIGQDQLMMSGADLVLLGHIHLGQQVGGAFYSSSIYAVNVGEDHPHGFYIHEQDPLAGSWEHRFISTPCKRLARFMFDLTAGDKINYPADMIESSVVRLDISAWQDETKLINKDEIREELIRWGAIEVDIRVTPIPRVTVRAAEVLKADALRDKIQRRADLVGDVVAVETLAAADILEMTPPDQLVRMVMGGAA